MTRLLQAQVDELRGINERLDRLIAKRRHWF
jgi:hypothetical protein